MGRIVKKHYLKITFGLESPLCVGSGKNESTDQDILLDKRGIPYIPGSAVAGVFREACKGLFEEDRDFKYYFGDAPINTGQENSGSEDEIIESRIVFFDATLVEKEADVKIQKKPRYRISQRDGVALNEYKNAKKHAKFDWEILEGDCTFRTFVEISQEEQSKEACNVLWNIARLWKEADIRFGAKTTRGFGKIGGVEVLGRSFAFLPEASLPKTSEEKEGSIEDWLKFDMFKDEAWRMEESAEKNKIFSYDEIEKALKKGKWVLGKKKKLTLGLCLKGGLSIRRYTTEITQEDSSLDHEQMTTLTSQGEVPVIPGTTWAGAIGSRMEELLGESRIVKVIGPKKNEQTYHYFGAVEGKNKEKSLISFGESRLSGAKPKIMSRNAIDRFLGSTAEGALFTEKIYWGGSTTLEISFSDPYYTAAYYSNDFKKALAASLCDLHEGYLAIGGATSIGRGIFSVVEINGKKFAGKGAELFEKLYAILQKLLDKKEE